MRNLIIFGGTFDPIHKGHVEIAINVQNHFNFDRFVFLPCKIPVLKNNAIATPAQRIDMLQLALKNQDKNFEIDLSEINRDTPSYMVNTLRSFRNQLGENVAITLLMGADTFYQLPQWYEWQQLLSLANILVIKRAGIEDMKLPTSIQKLLIEHETHDDQAICHHTHGLIYHYDAGSFEVSSTWIRKQLAEGKDLLSYLPESVHQYIKQNGVYKIK